MTINLTIPDIQELKPRITVFGCGGAGGNAVNNMIASGLEGVDFVVANTDAQALALSKSPRIIQLGVSVTEGLGAGSHPEVGRAAAEESYDEINDHLSGAHMVFITAGMGGGTGTGAAPVVARAAREQGILTVGVVTKPFTFEGARRARLAEEGIDGVGMGLIALRRPRPGAAPEQVLEEITGADEALTGIEVEAFFARRAYLRDITDDALLATRLSTAPVLLERHSLPGPDGWQQIGAAVRRPGGPGAVLGVDEVFTALLAGCRGEVPLGTLIDQLAAHHGVDPDALAGAALPEVRAAIGRGILYQAG